MIKKVLKEYMTTLGLVWLGALIIFVFAYMLILKPQAEVKKKLHTRLEELKADHAAALDASNEKRKKQLAEEVEKLNDRLRRFVTDANGAANMTFDISQIANKNNVSSFSIKARDNRGFFEIPQCELIGENRMDVSFTGRFNQFANFLNALERHEPVVFIDKFSISQAQHQQEQNKVSMSLSVLVEKRKDS